MPVQVLDFLVAGVKLRVLARTDGLLARACVLSTKDGRVFYNRYHFHLNLRSPVCSVYKICCEIKTEAGLVVVLFNSCCVAVPIKVRI